MKEPTGPRVGDCREMKTSPAEPLVLVVNGVGHAVQSFDQDGCATTILLDGHNTEGYLDADVAYEDWMLTALAYQQFPDGMAAYDLVYRQ
jgi:hypothetical protein